MQGSGAAIPRLVLASRNPGKLAELRDLLAGLRVQVLGPDVFPGLPEVDETGATFRANAELKARAIAAATGCWALADDSGLAVDALDGAPGVQSARYAGPDATDASNNARLLDALRDVPADRRGARFHCCAVVAAPDGRILAAADGTTEGHILPAPEGTEGFGYDPLFFSADLGKPFGLATRAEKHTVSHRARALAAIRTVLATLLA